MVLMVRKPHVQYLISAYYDFVSYEDIGTSYEGRTLRVLKICTSATCGENDKPALYIDAGEAYSHTKFY